ncbi:MULTISPECIES: hypothetical protein [Helcococcus]|uniref:CopG family transcriptional regulator n=1 Tax=Helcococcus bovis TaxID=3153252 RepID=A0ABW9F8A4_9FIRM
MEKENKLIIKKLKNNKVRDGRQVRVSQETYDEVVRLSNEANMNIGDISEIIMEWAIKRVVIQ